MMQKNLLILLLTFFTTITFGQQISIQNFNTGGYGSGASISVPIKVSGCFALSNTFKVYLSDASGSFASAQLIGTNNNFFTPFVNGIIPAGTAPGSGYKIRVESTNPVVSAETSAFSVSATSMNPVPNPLTSGSNTLNDSTFGKCLITSNQNITLVESVPAGHSFSAVVYDSLGNTVPSTSTATQVQFQMVPGNYYTVLIKIENSISKELSTKSVLVLASSNNLSLQTSGANDNCLPDTKIYTVNVTGNGGIRTNYPGTKYTIEWGDGATDVYTHCELIAKDGEMMHDYVFTSCGQAPITDLSPAQYNAFRVNVKASNVYCPNSFTSITTYSKVWQKPIADFVNPIYGCINTPITFINTSQAGLSGYNNVVNCIDVAVYEWYVDGNYIFNAPKDLVYTFTTLGYHTIKLVALNDPCSDEETKVICIEDQLLPNFKVNGQDSLTGCAPLSVTITNTTSVGPNPCRPPQYNWQVLIAPGMTPAVRGVDYTIAPHDSASSPTFVFLTPGHFIIRLTIPNSCGNFQKDVPVRITDVASVTFSTTYKRYCDTAIIDFSLPPHRPNYNTTSGSESYLWTITGGSYTYLGGTSATSAYPIIKFNDYASYTVHIQFNNACGTQNAVQTIVFDKRVTATASNDTTVCNSTPNIQLQGSSTGPMGSVVWSVITGSGSLSNTGVNNPIYTFSAGDRTAGVVRLLYTVNPAAGSACPPAFDTVIITLRPAIAIISSPDTTICSGNALSYLPVSNISYATFTWTSTVVSGVASGNSASGTGSITDLLINTQNANAVVKYTITPFADGCTGQPFDYLVTVIPAPNLNIAVTKDTICTGDAVNIQLGSSYAGTLYSWSTSVISGSVTGYSNQLTPAANNIVSQVLVNNGTVNAVLVYTFQVYPSGNTNCPGEIKKDTIVIRPGATVADAGPDRLLCNASSITLQGNQPVVGTGIWSQISGPVATIVNPALYNTAVNGLTGNNVYAFVWKINGEGDCPSTSDTLVIVNRPAITPANAGNDIVICDFTGAGNTVLSGNVDTARAYETAQWTILSQPTGGNGAFSSATDPKATFSFNASGTYQLVWTISNDAGCTPTKDTVTIRVFDKPVVGNINPAISNICKGGNVTFTVSSVTGVITKWQYNTAPFGDNVWIDTLVTNPSITFNNIQDSISVRLIVNSDGAAFGCNSADTSNIAVVNVSPTSKGGHVAASDTVCKTSNGGTITLTGHVGAVMNWETSNNNGVTWTAVSNTTISFTYSNLQSTTWIRAVVKSGTCPSAYSDTVIITVIEPVTAAYAGNDQLICNNNTTLTGNTAGVGENGTWSQIAGPNSAVIGSVNAASTSVSNLIGGTYRFVWTLANGTCPSTADTVEVVVRPAVTPANAGADIVICDFVTSGNTLLSGNIDTARSYETAQWSILSQPTGGNGTFSNASDPKATFSFSKAGTYQLVWTISNDAGCTPTKDTVTIYVFNKPVVGNVTPAISNICKGESLTFTVSSVTGDIKKWQYNPAPFGDNVWIDTLVTNTSITFNNIQDSISVRVIVNSDGVAFGCNSADTSNIAVVNVAPTSKGGHVAASDTVCKTSNGGTITLTGHVGNVTQWETSNNNGITWTVVSNTTTAFTYSNLQSTTWIRALVKSGTCPAAYSDTVIITVKEPVTVPAAGNDQLICNNSTTLTGNAAGSGETGTWSQIAGPNNAVIGSANTTSTTISNLIGGTYRFVWTLSNGTCPSTADTVEVVVRPGITPANAGNDIVICDFTGAGNTVLSGNVDTARAYETAQWTILSQPTGGNGTFSSATDPKATFSFSASGTYQLVWTISNDAGCTPTKDTVTIRVFDKPVVGNINPAISNICKGGNVTFTVSSVTGVITKWQYNTAPFGDNVWIDTLVTNPSITFNNIQDSISVRLIVNSDGAAFGCNSADTSNIAVVNVSPTSKGGHVAASDTVCKTSNGGTITLTGHVGAVMNWETSNNNGVTWTAVSNTTISFTYSNLQSTTWIRAVVKSGTCPSAYSDTVIITVIEPVTAAYAGNDQLICNNNTTLTGNTAGVGENGTWSQIAGPNSAVIGSVNAASTSVSNLIGGTYRFVWTLANGTCPSTADTVEVVVRPAVTPANAGADIVICDFVTSGNTLLSGNIDTARSYETAQWSILSQPTGGNGTFSNASDPKATFSFSKAGTYQLVWTISNDAGCTPTKDTVTIYVFNKPVVGNVTPAISNICKGESLTFTVSSVTGDIKKWQYNPAPFGDNVWIDTLVTNTSITFNNIQDSISVRVIVNSDGVAFGCNSADTSNIAVVNVAPTSKGGHVAASDTVCKTSNGGTITLTGHVGNVTQWETSNNNGITWTVVSNTTTAFTYSNLQSTTWIRALVKSGTCPAAYSDTVIITVKEPVTVPAAGNDQLICNNSTTLTGNAAGSGETGTWSQIAGPNNAVIGSANTTSTTISNLIGGTYRFVWTLSNGTCPSTADTVEVVVRPGITPANAGNDIVICDFTGAGNTVLSGNVDTARAYETAQWTILSQPTGGNGTFSSATDPKATFSFSASGTYQLVWTISNDAGCTPTKDTVTIYVFNKPVAGPISGNTNICAGQDVTITMANFTGVIKKWQYNPAPFNDNIWIDTLVNSPIIQFIAVQDSFMVRVIVQSEGFSHGCLLSDTSNTLIVNAAPGTIPGTTGANATVCYGNNSGTVTLTGNVGSVTRWEFSADNGTTWTAINNTTTSQAYSNLTTTTWYRAIVESGNCGGVPSSITIITVVPPVTVALAGNDQLICNNSTTITGNAAGNGETGTWSQIAGPGNATIASANTASTSVTGLVAGTYQFVWTLANGTCPSTADTVQIVVRPAVTPANAGNDIVICDFVTAGSTALSGNANTTRTFENGQWSILSQPAGGNGTLTNAADPQATFSFSAAGTYQLVWTISNDAGCTPTKDTVSINVFNKPVAGPISGNSNICVGQDVTVTMANFTGVIKKWQYNPAPFNDNIWIDTAVTGSTIQFLSVPDSFMVRVIVVSDGASYGCTGADTSNILVVNAAPGTVPGTTGNNATVCAGTNNGTVNLTGNVGTIVRWEYSTDNGTTWVAINNTTNSLTYNNLTTTTWYRAIVGSANCGDVASTTTVITVSQPVTIANAGADQLICNNTTSLTGNAVATGETGAWSQISGPNTASIASANTPGTTISNLVAGTYKFVWKISNVGCPPSADTVNISVRPAVTIANAGNDTTICDFVSSSFIHLNANNNTGRPFETKQWSIISQPTTGNATFSDVTDPKAVFSFNSAGVYKLKWMFTNDAGCTPTMDTVIVYVYDKPVAGPLSANNNVCAGTDVTVTMGSYTGVITKWQYNPAPINDNIWKDTIVTTPSISFLSVQDTMLVRVIVTSAGTVCNSSDTSSAILIAVIPGTVPGFTAANDTVCRGGNGGIITLSGNTGSVVRWESSENSGNTWNAIANTNTSYTYSNLQQTTWFRAVVQSGTCGNMPSTITIITVIDSVTIADAGPDKNFCKVSQVVLAGNNPKAGETGTWTQVAGGSAIIANIHLPNTTVTNMVPGNYKFVWSIDNGTCPANRDTVAININADIVNPVDTSTQVVCFGQSVTVVGNDATGGNGTYQYQWQQSTDGINWTNIPGQVNPSLNIIPSAAIYVRRVVNSQPCLNIGDKARILVQPPVANNTIVSNQTICVNTVPASLTGSTPTGGTGTYQYQWQESTDGGATWNGIPGATNQHYAPGALTMTTLFKRIVTSGYCAGAESSASDSVIITVNPDAKAQFTFAKDTSCPIFVIDTANVKVNHFAGNGAYQWFANGSFIGNGATFPGYSINNSGETVIIKLVAVSGFGCQNDTMQHAFYAKNRPAPAFSISDTIGCGPLTVSFTNLTPNPSIFNFKWDFGNGLITSGANPGNITYQANPTFDDTVYTVRLTVYSECDTAVLIKTIRVKSKPRAVFNPDKTIGCSPLTVNFKNLSKGATTYTWDFGDGTKVNTSSSADQQHTFISAVQDTFVVKLIAANQCGVDTQKYSVIVTPNNIQLYVTVNGSELSGCGPHTVSFYNNTVGATSFLWNFDDGNTLTTFKSNDTITHTFLTPGLYNVSVRAMNGCSDTAGNKLIRVLIKPLVDFTAAPLSACVGENIRFTNLSDTITGSTWKFGDGTTSTLTNPAHSYSAAGTYTVTLIGMRTYASGNTCIDSVKKTVVIYDKLPGDFSVSDSVSVCVPFSVTFTNNILPSALTTWDFGDGKKDTGNVVTHTFITTGNFLVTMNAVSPGGCKYEATKTIVVNGPQGTWSYEHGNLCGTAKIRFDFYSTGVDSVKVNFGDGTSATTTANVLYHTYTTAGTFVPSAIMYAGANGVCQSVLLGKDTIRVEILKAGFKSVFVKDCGQTKVIFTDTSRGTFGVSQYAWNFGDGNTSTVRNPENTYFSANTWPVTLVIRGALGCFDTTKVPMNIPVANKPKVTIISDTAACINEAMNFQANVVSADPIALYAWSFSNGGSANVQNFTTSFGTDGNHTARLVVSTVNGCSDTANKAITVRPRPFVKASEDMKICKPEPVQLSASGAINYTWTPASTLTCVNCATPIATPQITTTYVVVGTNQYGCSAKDTVRIDVAQPVKVNVKPADTLCVGQTYQLSASGADIYKWSPWLTLNNANIPQPIASPVVNTRYRVIGSDSAGCYSDTAYVQLTVGKNPTVDLGPDLVLAAGTQLPLKTVITNGPIVAWDWKPFTDLNCTTCPLPIAFIKKDIKYSVTVTNNYGCKASDTISIKTFCESTQVFIPNLFTPDGDGINDLLMVRGSGIKTIKSFRIFSRWGEVVFEKSNFAANDKAHAWDGKVRGVPAPPDVYVYTCEVMCENDATFIYKGNVAIIK